MQRKDYSEYFGEKKSENDAISGKFSISSLGPHGGHQVVTLWLPFASAVLDLATSLVGELRKFPHPSIDIMVGSLSVNFDFWMNCSVIPSCNMRVVILSNFKP